MNSQLYLKVFIAVSMLFFSTDSKAHEGHEHRKKDANVRVWKFRDGRVHLHGAFVASSDGTVQVRCTDGTVISLATNDLTEDDQKWIEQRRDQIRQLNGEGTRPRLLSHLVAANTERKPTIADAFEPFAQRNALTFRQDAKFFYVESNSIPDHPMMIGITAWQQQVPLPQAYVGNNAWRIPLEPVVAKSPLSAKTHFFRGAIALAANGVPIFNPIKNDGRTDTFLAGELDEYGGHCGRADDYHYHIAPTHLQDIVGQDNPIAYSLDGYAIYGVTEPDGSKVEGLDPFNGHSTLELGYHYHATKTYPYLNGGFHGEVIERGGQVDPQPQAVGIRPATSPLKDAKIIGFERTDPSHYQLTYEIQGKKGTVDYSLADDGSARFNYTDSNSKKRTEIYPSRRRGAAEPPPRRDPPTPKTDPGKLNPPDRRSSESTTSPSGQPKSNATKSMAVSSPAIGDDQMLPIEFTCDGASASLPVRWEGAPSGTKSFAISLWHTAPDQEKSYWVVYNIPADTHGLDKNDKKTGTVGLNDKKKAAYDPMCSKGPGIKKYHLTVYALSKELQLSKGSDNRAGLLKAIKDITLAEATLDFLYERKK